MQSEVADAPDLAVRLPLSQRIFSKLLPGARTGKDMADDLGVDGRVVRTTLSRMRAKGIVVSTEYGRDAVWSLVTPTGQAQHDAH
jgi:predicted transcriptional regulator